MVDSGLSQVTTDCTVLLMHTNQIIQLARTMIDTPWHHAGRLPGVGLDCVGLILVPAQLAGYKITDLKNYSQYPDGDTLLSSLRDRFNEIPLSERSVGDVLVFRIKGKLPQHVAWMTDVGMIHSWQNLNKVCEHNIGQSWTNRLTHAFRCKEDAWQQ